MKSKGMRSGSAPLLGFLIAFTVLLLSTGRLVTTQYLGPLSGTAMTVGVGVVVSTILFLKSGPTWDWPSISALMKGILLAGSSLVLLTIGSGVVFSFHNPAHLETALQMGATLALAWLLLYLGVHYSHYIFSNGALVLSIYIVLILVGSSLTVGLAATDGSQIANRATSHSLLLALALLPMFSRSRALTLGSIPVFWFGIVLTDSRLSALVSIVVVSTVLIGCLKNTTKFATRLYFSVSLVAGAVATAVLQDLLRLRSSFEPFIGFIDSAQPSVEIDENRVEQGSDQSDPGRELNSVTTGRWRVWQKLLADWSQQDSVLGGLGSGYSSMRSQQMANMEHPHNEYIRFLVDNGVLGLFAFLATGALILVWFTFRVRASSKNASATGVSLIIIIAAQSVVSNPLIFPHFVIPFAFFLGVAMGQIRRRRV